MSSRPVLWSTPDGEPAPDHRSVRRARELRRRLRDRELSRKCRPAVPQGADNSGRRSDRTAAREFGLWHGRRRGLGTAGAAAFPPDAAGPVRCGPVARGRYLAVAGDCKSCHTNPGGQEFAGARPIRTPFGIIFSANITPDPKTGIGQWTEADFYRALHKGIAHGGKNLYPVFPYNYFTRMSRADVDAIWTYLQTLPPTYQVKPRNQLPSR